MSSVLLFVFLSVQGSWATIPVLILLGFFAIAPQPVLLALVQDTLPDNRAAANGLYMALSFLVRSAVLVAVGAAGDAWGLRTTFLISGGISVLAAASVFLLPKTDSNILVKS